MTEIARPRPGKRDPSVPDCGKWMPKAKAPCARASGHGGACRTRKALDAAVARLVTRYAEDPEFRARSIAASSAWQSNAWRTDPAFRERHSEWNKERYRRVKAGNPPVSGTV